MLGEEPTYGLVGDARNRVPVQRIPNVEREKTARLQDTRRLANSGRLVGKKHEAELADDGIEAVVLERQVERVGLPFATASMVRFITPHSHIRY